MTRQIFLLLALAAVFAATNGFGAEQTRPNASELQRAGDWIESHWNIESNTTNQVPVGIHVVANHDPVRPKSRGETPLNFAGRQYARGLYCHAFSHLDIVLDKPAKTFVAKVGIDSNDDTRPGKGSVRFVVNVGDSEKMNTDFDKIESEILEKILLIVLELKIDRV